MLQDRVAIAYPQNADPITGDVAGLAIWASVSEEVDAKIREQIKSGTWPIRLKSAEWSSGEINWLFDVIAPNQAETTRVFTNLKQVLKGGDLNLHPIIMRLVEPDALGKMGAQHARTGKKDD